ncbi:calcium-transporting ATPase 1 [Clostridium homopropionicum DSM 5847]|uniref:Calcium-transporting ATPase 1 n=1 Tax=Clostridium homopropionicum DSM 5847 TaxID=1121318 RepID=A0A0L6ZE57_9CLOT|nr:HAD-IC family P-type ATPase [Clostridium homopropionicum]KOA21255.1 calcium-transporting ATPase 1 [Clostridium homopropionicum DSM 5847]SFG28822.1 ATPase, P-type (transporting), HAD superfamily, subfamily IC [Clostridium homopropionicum]
MKTFYNLSWNEVIKELNSDVIYGLSDEMVEQRRKDFGDNKTIEVNNKGFIRIFIKQLLKFYSIVGIIICLGLFYFKELNISIIILSIIIFCSILYAFKEYRKEEKLNQLRSITPKKAVVVRNKRTSTLNTDEIVVGDIVYLEKGDIVPADIRLIECNCLKVKESAITGDKEIIDKYETKIEDREISLSEMKNIVFKSSFIIEGDAKGIVINVGDNTEIGMITKSLLEDNLTVNVLEESISKIANSLTRLFILWAVLFSAYSYSVKDSIQATLKLISLSYFIIVPLEILLSVGFISFIINKVKHNEGIQLEGLSTMKLLSDIDVMIFDKIGFLTEEKMYVNNFFTNGKLFEVNSIDIEENMDNIDRIIKIGLACNDAKINSEDEFSKGTLIEKAIIKQGMDLGINKKAVDLEQPRVFQIPYDVDKRIRTTLNKIDDKYRASIVGSVDKLLERCTHVMRNGIEVEISLKDIEEIKNADLKLSMNYLHAIAFAYRNFSYEPSVNENIESNLVFVGLIGFYNPIHENIQGYIRYCKALAIKPVIITEDNKIVATVLGERIKVLNKNDLVLSGVELDNMEEDEIEKYVERVGVYSRISSQNKLKIVESFKRLGYKTIVTGDRFTDLPSFKMADLGIAVGTECTNMAKKLSDIYVNEKGLNKILNLMNEGRKAVLSIKHIITFNLVIAIIEMMFIILANTLSHNSIKSDVIILTNFIILAFSSLLIFSEHNNIIGNRNEKLEIDKNILGKYTTGMIIYIAAVIIEMVVALYFGINKNTALGEMNASILISLSPIIFSMYFVEIKKLLKSKMSTIFLIINFIVFSGFFALIYMNNQINLSNIIWDLKLIIPMIIIQIIIVAFTKELDKKY